jgi:hypothetical protein
MGQNKMIKLIDILKELNFDDLGKPFAFGDEQQVWRHPKDKNLVIKQYGMFSDRDAIDRMIGYYKKYPKFIAKSFKSENPKYYFQEKIDVKSSMKDIHKLTLSVYNQVINDLMKKYPTPLDAYKAGFKNQALGNMISSNTDYGDRKGNWNKLISKTIWGLEGKTDVPMDLLFDPYIYKNYTNNMDLVKKLKPIYEFGTKHTKVGAFHEANIGYDKNGDFKIIDI